MLEIIIPGGELWDEKQETFISTKSQKLILEHSLVSISKWEAKWHKPFLSDKEKTYEETIDYIKCMTISQNIDSEVYKNVTSKIINEIKDYINDPMTATTVPKEKGAKPSREQVTSELIYYWMTELNIPVEFQKWHLNRLLTLIRVCEFKRTPPKKRSKREIMSMNAAINAARRQELNSKG